MTVNCVPALVVNSTSVIGEVKIGYFGIYKNLAKFLSTCGGGTVHKTHTHANLELNTTRCHEEMVVTPVGFDVKEKI